MWDLSEEADIYLAENVMILLIGSALKTYNLNNDVNIIYMFLLLQEVSLQFH